MTARIATVSGVRLFGDNLTIVTIKDGDATHEVVANLQEDRSSRWAKDEVVVYVSEGSIVPDDVMKERGYWNTEKLRGGLEGKKYNRVKMRRFGPEDDRFESRGLIFKTFRKTFMGSDPFIAIERASHPEGGEDGTGGPIVRGVSVGDDVSEFFGITEQAA